MAVTDMDVDDLQHNPFLSPRKGLVLGCQYQDEMLIYCAGYLDVPGQSLSPTCMEQMTQTNCLTIGSDNEPNGNFICHFLNVNRSDTDSSSSVEPCTPLGTFSYFTGSEISFVATIIVEIFIVVGISFFKQ